MTITSGFFDSRNGDRKYTADQFGELMAGLITDGVVPDFGDSLRVTPGSNLSVKVGTGRAWFNGTWTYVSEPETKTISAASTSNARIDAVVLQIDKSITSTTGRQNKIIIVKGTASASPVRPNVKALDNESEGIFHHPLAYVQINANATTIAPSSITSVIGTDECPFANHHSIYADLANAANKDNKGADLTSYINGVSLSGTTLKFTRGSGSTALNVNIANELAPIVRDAFKSQTAKRVTRGSDTLLSDFREAGVFYVYNASFAADAPTDVPGATPTKGVGLILINLPYPLSNESRIIQIAMVIGSDYYRIRTLTGDGEISIDWKYIGPETFATYPAYTIKTRDTERLGDIRESGIHYIFAANYATDKPIDLPGDKDDATVGLILINLPYPLGEAVGRIIQIAMIIGSDYYRIRTVYSTGANAGSPSIDWKAFDNTADRNKDVHWYVFGSSSEAGYYSRYTDETETTYKTAANPDYAYTALANDMYFHMKYEMHAAGGRGFVARSTQDIYPKLTALEELNTVDYIEPNSLITVHYAGNDYTKIGTGKDEDPSTDYRDYTMGSIDDQLYNSDGSEVKTYYARTKRFIEKLVEKAPDSTIIFLLKQFKTYHWEANRGSKETHYSLNFPRHGYTYGDYVEATKEVCDYYGIRYIDWSKGTGFVNLLNAESIMPDGKHLTRKGQEMRAKMLVHDLMYY